MNLKTDIEQIFATKINYAEAEHAVNQASSLYLLSGDLYTDSKRFIYELLQNADDSPQDNDAVKVWLKIFDNNLIVAHSGKSFDIRDLKAICNVNNGTKRSDSTKTGYKGIGFKAVFGQSEHVTIYTDSEYFRFDSSFDFEWKWNGTQMEWEKENDRKFQFPWQITPIYTELTEVDPLINQYLQTINASVATIIKLKNVEETTQAIHGLSKNINMFLFLKNICEINFDLSEKVSVKIIREKSGRITLTEGDSKTVNWEIKTINLEVPGDVKTSLQQDKRNTPDKLLNADYIELSFAAKIGDDGITKLKKEERFLYSYLPTDETKYAFPVLVNTSFLTTASREALHADSKWNQWLFKNIAIEIFRWISELVKSEYQYQAYRLIPEKTFSDQLGDEFNIGVLEAIATIPFVITRDDKLVKVEEAIIDFTFLSEKSFVGEDSIKNFIARDQQTGLKRFKKFAKNTGFSHDFKKLGSDSFEWKDLNSFFSSKYFSDAHSIFDNIELIKHLKLLSESEKVKEVTIETLKELPFIWDHKNRINCPGNVCIPRADDQNWDRPDNELSFLNQDLLNWINNESKIRIWFENLGVTEKTDITFIYQIILKDIDSYISYNNAVDAITDLFFLYKKGELKEDLIRKLDRIKLLTMQGSLCRAKDCFLSDYYTPRLQIEDVLEEDIFVCDSYCRNQADKDEWKRFFKMLGVQEGVNVIIYSAKNTNNCFIDLGFRKDYFNSYTDYFYNGKFSAKSFSDMFNLSFLQFADNYFFSVRFWSDVVNHIDPKEMIKLSIAYWGYSGLGGQESGNTVENYIHWTISNVECIPVLSKECKKSSSVLVNSKEIKDLSGNYLPVFNGPELTSNWKSFFNFRTSLSLSDYLELLSAISLDVDKNGEVKIGNQERIQSIYHALLEQCGNWSEAEIKKVNQWADSESLLNTKNEFTKNENIMYFRDGNESIFQDQFKFLKLSAENKRHPQLETLLGFFHVTILKESDFKLIYSQNEECSQLISHLKSIIPFFYIWIKSEVSDEQIIENLSNIESKISVLNIYQSSDLKITYEDVHFVKNVNVHFDKKDLYVTKPWSTNSVLLRLPEVLCRYLELLGHDKKLDFLLRAKIQEIHDYFEQEGLIIPDSLINEFEVSSQLPEKLINLYDFESYEDYEKAVFEGDISSEFYHIPKTDFVSLKLVESLIARSVKNVVKHLDRLPEYDCSHYYEIAKSIIGGITKNGNDVTIVARPSDGDKVLLYYTSEYDVLQYVNAEFWCEDGVNLPRQITLGQLLKETGINRIPIKNIELSDADLDVFKNTPRSEELDFSAVPFAPQKIAKIVSSFANTTGGMLIFGMKENGLASNEFVGLSSDFNVVEITKKAILSLSPIPEITYDWLIRGENHLFMIKVEKANDNILFEGEKYIRKGGNSVTEKSVLRQTKILNVASHNKTIAIIIAIEDYAKRDENQISKVKYAKRDAEKFKDTLINKMNIEERDIVMYTNEQALKNDLEYNFRNLFHSLANDDRLIFYYVGHGFHDGIENYLSTYDMHKYNIKETSISLRKVLLDPLLNSKCRNALVFIDACAQSLKSENSRSQLDNICEDEFITLSKEYPYYATFLSCHPGQSSYSCDNLKNGVWTHHLVKAINGDVPEVINGKKYVTDHLLQDYLTKSVEEYVSKNLGYEQTPKAIFDSSSENVIVKID